MSFEIFEGKRSTSEITGNVVSVSPSHARMSRDLFVALGEPSHVQLFWDTETRRAAIRPGTKGYVVTQGARSFSISHLAHVMGLGVIPGRRTAKREQHDLWSFDLEGIATQIMQEEE